MKAHLLDRDWIAKFARGPAESTVKRAISVHSSVRALLGESDFETILQGSYRTGTALWDLNDVDILAISRHRDDESLRSGDRNSWERLFRRIESHLRRSHRYAGKWERRDKCIRLATTINVDVVPSVSCGAVGEDPIYVYSLGGSSLKRNWPRGHYDSTAKKNANTSGCFLPAVRLFKRWVGCVMPVGGRTPSYYVQCLLHSLPDRTFSGDLANDYVAIAQAILNRHGVAGGYLFARLPRTTGDGNLFTDEEWKRDNFLSFEKCLRRSLPFAEDALEERDAVRARNAWRMAFAGYEP